MTTHTEAREAVAVLLEPFYMTKVEGQHEYWDKRKCEARDRADAILARLGELGYVQRDRLIRGNAVLAAAKVIEASEETMLGWVDIAEAAIAAAIAKTGESA